MRRDRKYLFIGLCALMMVALLCGATISGENATITGTVNDSYQITADDGSIYEVGDTEKGNEMVVNCVGKQVKATGVVEEIEDVKTFAITSYEVIGE